MTFDADARLRAVDPSRNILLEASAGTGKTRVLVERYVNLLLAGVEPEHILAITFTRKGRRRNAAADRRAAERGEPHLAAVGGAMESDARSPGRDCHLDD